LLRCQHRGHLGVQQNDHTLYPQSFPALSAFSSSRIGFHQQVECFQQLYHNSEKGKTIDNNEKSKATDLMRNTVIAKTTDKPTKKANEKHHAIRVIAKAKTGEKANAQKRHAAIVTNPDTKQENVGNEYMTKNRKLLIPTIRPTSYLSKSMKPR
jgi:hypothetical protein